MYRISILALALSWMFSAGVSAKDPAPSAPAPIVHDSDDAVPGLPFQEGDVLALDQIDKLAEYLPPPFWENRRYFFFEGMQLEIGPTQRDYTPAAVFEAASELGYEQPPELAAETLDHLHRQPWRGNIRELRHVIKAAALRAAGGPILVKHLEATRVQETAAAGEAAMAASANDTGERTFKERLEAQEREALMQTLRMADGNLTKGAELFGVPRTTYREKLVKNGLLGKSK